MKKHSSLPIKFSGWDTCGEAGDIQFYDAEFLEDFGPFKRGEIYAALARMDAYSILIGYDNTGEKIKETFIKYVAYESK